MLPRGSFRQDEVELIRYTPIARYVRGILLTRLPERRQLRSQTRLGGQVMRYSEIKAEVTHARSNGYIYVTLVTDYSIPTFRGSVILVTILNGKYPLMFITDFRYVWGLNQIRKSDN